MGSWLSSGPLLGPHYSTAPFKKDPTRRDPNLENDPHRAWGFRVVGLQG